VAAPAAWARPLKRFPGVSHLLVERFDFAKGTSSRSTKLAHGGVRYLEQLNLTLVLDALRERGRMLRNAPHLVHDLSFVVPAYSYFSLPYYGIGLKVYEQLSGSLSMGAQSFSLATARLRSCRAWPRMVFAAAFSITMANLTTRVLPSRCCARLRTWEEPPSTTLRPPACCRLEARPLASGRATVSGAVIELQAKVVINACGVHAEETLAFDGHTRGSLLP